MHRPKLRDNIKKQFNEPYLLGDFPDYIIRKIGKHDISGEVWGDIFAKSIDGDHLNSPVGLADVILDGMAWSVKSIKATKPHDIHKARVISGRCSPDYSYGIQNPHEDLQLTGRAVLGIWNERVNIAKDSFEPLRSILLIRNINTLEFTLYEHELHRFNTRDFIWKVNKKGNVEGYEIDSQKHVFTWQPHGSQFTIIHSIPSSAKKFILKRPPVLDFNKTMQQVNYDDSWVTILS